MFQSVDQDFDEFPFRNLSNGRQRTKDLGFPAGFGFREAVIIAMQSSSDGRLFTAEIFGRMPLPLPIEALKKACSCHPSDQAKILLRLPGPGDA